MAEITHVIFDLDGLLIGMSCYCYYYLLNYSKQIQRRCTPNVLSQYWTGITKHTPVKQKLMQWVAPS